MAYDHPKPGTLKRKRRRREDKPAISARLYLDSGLKGEVGVLSEDLVNDLYPGLRAGEEAALYSAVAPWIPHPSSTDSSWTVVPVRKQLKDERQIPPSTIRFPASASGTQSFVNALQTLFPNRTVRQNAAVEVRISDVVPLPLETVFVSVDSEALNKLEEVQKRYGGGFGNANGRAARKGSKLAVSSPVEELSEEGASVEEKRKQLLHDALSAVKTVHTGDFVALPLAHPVTHASAPPARILGCEPVSQGVLSPSTKIIVTSASDRRHQQSNSRALLSPRLAEESGEDEDSANEQFYSATENTPKKPIVTSKSTTDLSNTDDLFDSTAEESNLSDDSDDMISLAKPGISDQPSGLSSALTSATPRPFGNRTGVSTPGSVFSNATATTIRGGQSTRSKVFKAQGLLEKLPDELLHPKPPSDEDEEARVYIDATALARLGCFSGDWVKIEPSENHALPGLSAFGGFDASDTQAWRPVKVYSLPESMSKKPQRYQVNPRQGRRDSISSLVTNPANVATIYLSPVLLANLSQAENVSLAPLALNKRMSLKRPTTPRPGSVTSRVPPTASEVTLRKVVTPLSNERALNHALFANLKDYFEHKQRILKAGDLIAVSIDESLSRSIYEGDVEKDSSATSDLLSQWGAQDEKARKCGNSGVAWFAIEAVTAEPDEADVMDGMDLWGGAAAIDPTKMTMRQSGDERRKLPPTTNNAWPYYLGVKKAQAQSRDQGSGFTELPQPYVSSLQRRLRELISVSTSPRAVHLGMPPIAVLITSTQRSIGKGSAVKQTCDDLGMHYFPIEAYDIVSESGSGFDTQAQGLFEARCERALDCGAEFTVICIRHLDTLASDRVATSLKGVLEKCRVLVATTTDVDKIPDSVRGLFTHELEMSAPDEGEREGILRNIVSELEVALAPDVDLASIAVKTAALVAGDLIDVVDRATVARASRLGNLASSMTSQSGQTVTTKDIVLSGGTSATHLTPTDFETAVDFARKNFADSIGAPKIPNVQWSDVGGLTHVKDAVIETIQLPLSRPELFAKGLKKRSGILFYGPPGTGKTLLAKAIATEFSLNFFSVKGPELLNMYIGESEANVRRVFQRARDARPCVVFFDELDSVAPKRGNQGDSGGVMDRIVSQLLAELDGMSDGEESGGGVFVIGATNRPDLLDQALLRPGRFDKMLYLGISDTHDKQATILQALTRKCVYLLSHPFAPNEEEHETNKSTCRFTLDRTLSLPRVASTLPFTFTGADLYALCSDAMLKAVTRGARHVDARLATLNEGREVEGKNDLTVANFFDHHATDADLEVAVTEEDFLSAKKELVPSVSLEELGHYEKVRDSFEGTTKKKDEPDPQPQPAARPPSQAQHENARPRLSEVMKRATNGSVGHTNSNAGYGSKEKVPTMNGTGARRYASTAKDGTGAGAADSDADEDDFVIRTDKLSITGGSRPPSSRGGKGKGKGREASGLDGEGEDLYD